MTKYTIYNTSYVAPDLGRVMGRQFLESGRQSLLSAVGLLKLRHSVNTDIVLGEEFSVLLR